MNLGILFFILIIVFTSVGSFMYGGQMIEQPTRNNLFRGALVWIWGPSLPDQVTNIYPGVPARITTVDLKNHPDRPLGVELLTSFGNSKRIRGHIWAALSYEETGDNDATRRNRKGAREREAGDREQGHVRKLMAEKDSSGWEQDLNFEQGRIVFVCPRQNFANSENGMLAILQILMLEGWTDIFERGVEVSGLLMSAAFFGVVVLVGRYMTGSLAIASVIIGWREHSSGQFAIIRAEAVRDYRVKLLKEQYKDRIIRQSIAAEKHRRQVKPETTKLAAESIASTLTKRHEKFDEATRNLYLLMQDNGKYFDLRKKVISSNKNPIRALAGQDVQDVETDDKDEMAAKQSLKKNFKRNLVVDKAQDEDKLALEAAESKLLDLESLKVKMKQMSDVQQEMYLRDGLDLVQLGVHVANQLEAVAEIFRQRILKLRADAISDKGNATYYLMQIIPIKEKARLLAFKIEGLRYGFQTGNSLYLFPPLHPFRVFACRLVFHRWFQIVVILLIFCSCAIVAADRPGLSQKDAAMLSLISTFLSCFFISEMIFKIVALNCQVYMSSAYNKLDFVIILSSIADEIMKIMDMASDSNLLKFMRILRAFRVLRILSRLKGLALILRTLWICVNPLLSSIAIVAALVFLFAMLGMQLFQGKLHFCSDPLISLESECIGTEASSPTNRVWLNQKAHFDWIGRSVASGTGILS
jgi:hypothetical protein